MKRIGAFLLVLMLALSVGCGTPATQDDAPAVTHNPLIDLPLGGMGISSYIFSTDTLDELYAHADLVVKGKINTPSTEQIVNETGIYGGTVYDLEIVEIVTGEADGNFIRLLEPYTVIEENGLQKLIIHSSDYTIPSEIGVEYLFFLAYNDRENLFDGTYSPLYRGRYRLEVLQHYAEAMEREASSTVSAFSATSPQPYSIERDIVESMPDLLE